jgi:hypothetical protein
LEHIKEHLDPDEEAELVRRTRQIIDFHGGADENLLMTGLLPFLNEKNLLHRLARFDFRAFFDSHFVRHGKVWYTEDQVDLQTRILKPLDFIPAEKVTEGIIYNYLKEHRYAAIDDLLNLVYTNLVNAYRPGVETIHTVLNRIADIGEIAGQKRPVYYLKPQQDQAATVAPDVIQKTLFDQDALVSKLEHNEIILRLAQYARSHSYQVHIGETEQRKDWALRGMSMAMLDHTEYGLLQIVFDTVKEIDLLILTGNVIVSAVEVATTVETADKAINNRFRNLHTVMPNLSVRKFVIVRDEDVAKANDILYTPANAKDHFFGSVEIMRISQLTEAGMAKLLNRI